MHMPNGVQNLTPTEMWAEVSSSASHFLHSGLSINPIKWRCLCRVLCPVRSLVTVLDCNLLNDRNLTLVPRLEPDINSRARRELPRFCHRLWCWFPSLETPKAGSGPTNPPSGRAVPREPAGSFIASHPCMPRDPIKSHGMPSRDII
jgi:hypothetical protein